MNEASKVIIFASNEAIGSAYPPLNLAVEAATTGATVIVALSCRWAALINSGCSSASSMQDQFPLSSVMILKRLAIQYGVTFVVADPDCEDEYKDIPVKNVSREWIQKETTTAKLVVRI